jgi:hypothetical protein
MGFVAQFDVIMLRTLLTYLVIVDQKLVPVSVFCVRS